MPPVRTRNAARARVKSMAAAACCGMLGKIAGTTREVWVNGRTDQRGTLRWLIILGAICLPLIAVLVQEVTRDLRLLRTANVDNVPWTLAQLEIEFQEFQRAVEVAPEGAPPDLDNLRTEFDILYSRLSTIETSRAFRQLRQDPDFAGPVAALRDFLDATVPVIDGPDAALRVAIADWPPRVASLRDVVRRAATVGQSHFAVTANARRDSIAQTLLRLALVTSLLVAVMTLILVQLLRLRRQSEERGRELGSANARLGTILDTTLDAIVVADSHGRILEFNRAGEAMFGLSADAARNRPLASLLNMPQDDDGALDALLGAGRRTLDGCRVDGLTFPLEVALAKAEANGEKIIIGSLRDISHDVAAERELVEARDRAVAGEKAKSDFLAVMSHEIRTPLNGLLGNLGLIRDTALSDDQARFLRNMSISGDVLMQHVDAVMDISRLEADKVTLLQEPLHLAQLLQNVVDGQSGAAAARQNTLRWTWAGTRIEWVLGDAARLQQILLNLVGNAIKFTHRGDIVIEAEAMPHAQEPDLVEIELRVIDTGIGIAPDALDTIFEDFQTSDTSYGRTAGGAGLGLGIAQRLVRLMLGEIGVESTPGEGSVFWTRLPLPRATAPDRHARVAQPDSGSAACDILVVEDNDINLELIETMLGRFGHRTSTACNGRAALAITREQRFDLILMDISMPVMDGIEATRFIRSGGGPCSDVPIVALSANVLARNQARFSEAGMNSFLGKPFSKDELRAVLEEFLPESCVAPDPDAAARPERAPDPEVLQRLQDSFDTEVDALLDWLNHAPADTDDIAARCHNMAGTAAAFDAMALRDALVRVEEAAVTGDATRIERRVRALHQVWETSHPTLDRAGAGAG